MAGPLRYPKRALDDDTDYLRIDCYQYSSTKSQSQGGSLTRTNQAFGDYGKLTTGQYTDKVKKLLDSIILPIPSNIQDGNSVSYADSSLDGLTAGVYDAVRGGFTNPEQNRTFSQIQSSLSNVLSGTAGVLISPDAKRIFLNSIAAQAANIPFGGNLTVSQILARETGEILNPNMELLFNGVTLRSFKFSFKMTPRDGTEAKEIRKIIKKLKFYMVPGFGNEDTSTGSVGNRTGSTFLKSPGVFQLSYRNGLDIHPFLNRFKLCFLTDMSVNYTGEGTYATYGDGSPVSYIMDLSFKELEPIYRGDYTDIESMEF